ncbi:MAG: ATP-dependent protease ATPase subunit HslU [Candidatus Brocadiaceae bacterium]|nr:ATP-dependent protease ATPase subunit HslU [Candidatus Brocadiaceae bacterium]
MNGLTPRAIVAQLDQYIVGQDDAKRAVAIALRNRWRRQQLPEELREDILPKNIIMIGPTGVGKTEIARRLAGLANAPFVKVEASHYTEVGYHGRDVDNMVRELVELAVNMVRAEMTEQVRRQAEENAEERLLNVLYEPPEDETNDCDRAERRRNARGRLRKLLHEGKLDERTVEIDVTEKPVVMQGVAAGGDEIGIDMQGVLEQMLPPRTQRRRLTVAEARDVLLHQECERLLDRQAVHRAAIERAQNHGIIFIDEIDKIAGARAEGHGPDVSREGVQRDLLPIVEGCTVPTRYGVVRTDHILFIAAGAFTVAKPSDLIPELQGRFPIRVELNDLTRDDLVRILREPRTALTTQYSELLATEGVTLQFTDDAIERIAEYAEKINRRTQSIGARRLQTVMEKLLEDVSFDAPDMPDGTVRVGRSFVDARLSPLVEDEDLTRYIL